MRDNFQKIKLLCLYEMLVRDSSEEHPLCTSELCRRLEELQISCDRRTLARDIQLLNDFDHEVLSVFVGHEKGYYVMNRDFSEEELQVLVDAVEAAAFITKSKTEEMVGKLASQAGSNRKKLQRRMETSFGVYKHSNESILYSIAELRRAINSKCKVQFYYFDLGPHKDRSRKRDRILRKEYTVVDGKRVYGENNRLYVAEPLSLIYNEDNYYLMAYNGDPDRKFETVYYRVDRMLTVTALTKEPISEGAKEYRGTQSKRKPIMFKMYQGDAEKVTLVFEKKLLGSVIDRAGEDITVHDWDDDHYYVELDTVVASTFFGWVFQFGTQMKIASPDSVVERYKQFVKDVLNAYE